MNYSDLIVAMFGLLLFGSAMAIAIVGSF